MTSYHVLVSDDLASIIASNPHRVPACLRFSEQEPTDPERHPGMHWWLVEDTDADPSLEGKRVELTITRSRMTEDGPEVNEITERRVFA